MTTSSDENGEGKSSGSRDGGQRELDTSALQGQLARANCTDPFAPQSIRASSPIITCQKEPALVPTATTVATVPHTGPTDEAQLGFDDDFGDVSTGFPSSSRTHSPDDTATSNSDIAQPLLPLPPPEILAKLGLALKPGEGAQIVTQKNGHSASRQSQSFAGVLTPLSSQFPLMESHAYIASLEDRLGSLSRKHTTKDKTPQHAQRSAQRKVMGEPQTASSQVQQDVAGPIVPFHRSSDGGTSSASDHGDSDADFEASSSNSDDASEYAWNSSDDEDTSPSRIAGCFRGLMRLCRCCFGRRRRKHVFFSPNVRRLPKSMDTERLLAGCENADGRNDTDDSDDSGDAGRGNLGEAYALRHRHRARKKQKPKRRRNGKQGVAARPNRPDLATATRARSGLPAVPRAKRKDRPSQGSPRRGVGMDTQGSSRAHQQRSDYFGVTPGVDVDGDTLALISE